MINLLIKNNKHLITGVGYFFFKIIVCGLKDIIVNCFNNKFKKL